MKEIIIILRVSQGQPQERGDRGFRPGAGKILSPAEPGRRGVVTKGLPWEGMSSRHRGVQVGQPVKEPTEVSFPWGRGEEEKGGEGHKDGVRQGSMDSSSATS